MLPSRLPFQCSTPPSIFTLSKFHLKIFLSPDDTQIFMSRSKRGTASRTKLSCANCRRRHFKCGGEQPCERCWQDDLQCEYPTKPFSFKEWSPQEAGLPPLPALRENPSNVRTGIFVSENRRIESRYEILDSETKSPSTVSGEESQLSRGGSVRNEATILHPTDSAAGPVPLFPPITKPTEAF